MYFKIHKMKFQKHTQNIQKAVKIKKNRFDVSNKYKCRTRGAIKFERIHNIKQQVINKTNVIY